MVVRVPKFRVWDSFRKRMFYNIVSINFNFWDEDHCESLNGVTVNDFDDSGELCNFLVFLKHEQLMQYTGLKDKNDKEIFEGDIIKADCLENHEGIDIFSHALKVVYFNLGCFMVNPETCFVCLSESKNIEVVGNICQNPELVEKTDA